MNRLCYVKRKYLQGFHIQYQYCVTGINLSILVGV